MARYLSLSHPQSPDGPRPASIPEVRVRPVYRLNEDGSNVILAELSSHSGTHVDAPAHMVGGALDIFAFAPEEFVFERPLLIDVPLSDSELLTPAHLEPFSDRIERCDLLLIRAGWGNIRSTDPARYSARNPGFDASAARFLRERFAALRAVGMDFLSMVASEKPDTGIEAHKILFRGEGRRFLIFEDMDLYGVPCELCKVYAPPLLIEGFDSAPCAVLAELMD